MLWIDHVCLVEVVYYVLPVCLLRTLVLMFGESTGGLTMLINQIRYLMHHTRVDILVMDIV